MSTPPLERALRHKSRRRRFRQLLIRSVRFALLNSEAGAAVTPLPREQTEPTKAADPDIDNDKENDNENVIDNESDKNDDNRQRQQRRPRMG